MSFGGILGGIGSLIGAGTSMYNAYQQKKQQEYEKEVQLTTWEREDNAVQRRVKDLVNAGLNPVLAAGSAASTSSPIKLTTPQFDGSAIGEQANKMMGLMAMKKDIARTQAETNLVEKQLHNQDIQNKRNQLELDIRNRDFGLIKADGVRSDQKSWASETKDVVRMFAELFNQAKNKGSLLDSLGIPSTGSSPPMSSVPGTVVPGAAHSGPAGKTYYLKPATEKGSVSTSRRAHE